MPESANPVQQPQMIIESRLSSAFRFCLRGISGSKVFVPKKKVYLTDTVRFNRQGPISWSGKTTRRGAFEAHSAQAISAAYYFDLAARDYTLTEGAIELVIEGVPCSAFIESSQSRELIFCARSDQLRGRKHAADGANFVATCKNIGWCAMSARISAELHTATRRLRTRLDSGAR